VLPRTGNWRYTAAKSDPDQFYFQFVTLRVVDQDPLGFTSFGKPDQNSHLSENLDPDHCDADPQH
jgi:hypothetical protein